MPASQEMEDAMVIAITVRNEDAQRLYNMMATYHAEFAAAELAGAPAMGA